MRLETRGIFRLLTPTRSIWLKNLRFGLMVHPSTTMNHSSDHWKRTPADTPLGLLLRESLKTHHRAGPFALSLPIYTCRIASDMDLDQPALDPSAQRETGKVFGEKQSRGIRSSGSRPLKERGGRTKTFQKPSRNTKSDRLAAPLRLT